MLLQYIQNNEVALGWLAFSSFVIFLGSLIIVPFLVIRIPSDYFLDSKPGEGSGKRLKNPLIKIKNPFLRLTYKITKNAFGCIFILAGILMLVLPGQGILTIVIGIFLINFPGKKKFLVWLITRGKILRSINWLRNRSGRKPIIIDYPED